MGHSRANVLQDRRMWGPGALIEPKCRMAKKGAVGEPQLLRGQRRADCHSDDQSSNPTAVDSLSR